MDTENKPKKDGFSRFAKRIFVHNWDLKLGAIALGLAFWFLVILAV